METSEDVGMQRSSSEESVNSAEGSQFKPTFNLIPLDDAEKAYINSLVAKYGVHNQADKMKETQHPRAIEADGQLTGDQIKGMSDDENSDDRAAPSRKRTFLKDPSQPSPDCKQEENAEDLLQKVTGKRFSITQLFKRKSKKDESAKEEEPDKVRDTDETKQNEVENPKLDNSQ